MVSGLLLTPAERRRFSEHCRNEAVRLRGVMDQFGRIPGPTTDALAKEYRIKIVAYVIVANELDSTETSTIG